MKYDMAQQCESGCFGILFPQRHHARSTINQKIPYPRGWQKDLDQNGPRKVISAIGLNAIQKQRRYLNQNIRNACRKVGCNVQKGLYVHLPSRFHHERTIIIIIRDTVGSQHQHAHAASPC
jgi:hypothetical protein